MKKALLSSTAIIGFLVTIPGYEIPVGSIEIYAMSPEGERYDFVWG